MKNYEEIKSNIFLCFIVAVIINVIFTIIQTNKNVEQAEEIELLKQSIVEQQNEKEYYINRYKELEEKGEN